MKKIFIGICTVFLFLICNVAFSTTIHIPTDYPIIQQGITAAENGDTILIQPGTYVQNITFNGKNIVVGSLFLTTMDTSYISQTIIDGNQNGSVVKFEDGEDSTATLCGLTIANGIAASGGGILCKNNAYPTLTNCVITNNSTYDNKSGAGIYCNNAHPTIINIIISNNSSDWNGGGIYLKNSSSVLMGVVISENSANYDGGGLFCDNSNPHLTNVIISNNSADRIFSLGGGIYCNENSNPILNDVEICGNQAYYGAGICCAYNSEMSIQNSKIIGNTADKYGGGINCGENSICNLEGVVIKNNHADIAGGAIFCYSDSYIYFDNDNLCNIYSNYSDYGKDIFSGRMINVIVDTFTVMNPTNYHATPIENFTFDIIHSTLTQINSDVYVSPDGSNSNSGLSWADPLKTISYAQSVIFVDSLNPHTIFLASGTYGPATNGEQYPLTWISYLSLQGNGESESILEGNDENKIFVFSSIFDVIIQDITITNGNSDWGGGVSFGPTSNTLVKNVTVTENYSENFGGGIYCSHNSKPILENITISYNYAEASGGGIYCWDANPRLSNVIISNNIADGNYGGGIYCENSDPVLENVIIQDNSADQHGGGINCYFHSDPELKNVLIVNNTSFRGGGIYCSCESNPVLTNVTIYGNSASIFGGGILSFDESNPILTNSIIWNNSPEEIYLDEWDTGGEQTYVTISHTDIQGGLDDIVTNMHGTVYWLDGNINENPQFVDTLSDWSLQSSSCCINNGTPDTTGLDIPSVDLAGNPRIYNGVFDIIDMGAYEYQGEPDPIPDIVVDPLEIYFGLGTVDTISCIENVFILNLGPSVLEINSITAPSGFKVKKNDDLQFVNFIDAFSIPAYHDTLINVGFIPTTTQSYSGNLTITNNDPDEGVVLVALSGTGTTAEVAGGVIDQNTTWDADTVKVVETVIINEGITLSIEPGTVVDFQGHFKINVQGRILAIGAENDSIVFTKQGYVHYWDGWAGIHFDETSTLNDSSKFEYCKITRCYNDDYDAYGGAFFIKEFSKLSISHTEIYKNYVNAQDSPAGGNSMGAGIYCENSSPLITSSSIHSNISCGNGYWQYGSGGGLYLRNSSPTIMNTIIRDNEAQYGTGGALFLLHSSPHIINTSIINNDSDYGAIFCRNGSQLYVINTILYSNEVHEIIFSSLDNSNSITIEYSDIQGGEDGIVTNNNGTVYWLEGNIDEDPLFENGYHLGYGSPCIDAGTPDTTGLHLPPTDLDGCVRIWDGTGDSLAIIDMGCYEYGAPLYDIDEPIDPYEFSISQNYPNPFSLSTSIQGFVPKHCENMHLKIYNIRGQLVQNLPITASHSSSFGITWEGNDKQNRPLSNGIYLYQLTGKNYTSKIKKMILLR